MVTSSQLQAYCNTLEKDKKVLEKRVRELSAVQSSIYGSVSGHPTKITRNTNDTRSSVRAGLKGSNSLSRIDSGLTCFEQKGVSIDSDISSVLNNIANEITRCKSRISSLSSEISSTNNAIRRAKAEEKAARERAKAEAEARAKAAAKAKAAALNS